VLKAKLITPLFFIPFRLRFFRREYRNRAINALDVGCGNHSPVLVKRWFPDWNYYGLDREEYETDDNDRNAMTKYFRLDLSTDRLDVLPEAYFDVVIMAHIVEHLRNGLAVIRSLSTKMKKGGKIYIEFPSVRSLSLPTMYGTLNFCDDETHVRVYSVQEIANTLLDMNFRIIRAGTRRDWKLVLTLPVRLLLKFIVRRKIGGGDFWDVSGFASYVFAEKR